MPRNTTFHWMGTHCTKQVPMNRVIHEFGLTNSNNSNDLYLLQDSVLPS